MKVNKQLIEKYHRDECTPEEAAAVEAWLLDDESDDVPDLPANEQADQHKQAIWVGIEQTLPPENIKNNTPVISLWLKAGAACIVLALCVFLIGRSSHKKNNRMAASIEVDNSTALEVRHVNNDEYQLSVGPGTSARIDNREGVIHFTGSMIIKPQRDIEFSFGTYPQKETFKSGETYILLDEQHGDGQVTIVNERNLMDMPPVLQKRIITEFNI
ncbi:hypothetical protein IM792_18410 [Mucilaginibacter sp. JRF]|uniref:hypothetical protein n=1 Tax=Mucilaginibacter sp. JRF TaxID=2780088 RepID=UPI001881BF22|nr:hypothetical protein [Mucilaginibacter sp. JRF]MBE9586432.1 hypothetical protein [Mucilaginibacter sp. JRF]